MHGSDSGAYLAGKGGQDKIIGGTGDDTIIGGIKKDTLTGGGGANTFRFTLGDSYDTITDFDVNSGDKMVIGGNPAVTEFADMQIWQVGADTWARYGASSTIILKNLTSTDLTAAHFEFEP